MAKCGYCNATVLFGGVTVDQAWYCSQQCYEKAMLTTVACSLPPQEISRPVSEVQQGVCPVCQRPGPVDVSTAYTVWSVVYVTCWRPEPRLCCRACGRKHQAKALLFSLAAGWWGLPWGLMVTPLQILRNIVGMLRKYDPYQPSVTLERVVRFTLAAAVMQDSQQAEVIEDSEPH